jgi:hypothetical protein
VAVALTSSVVAESAISVSGGSTVVTDPFGRAYVRPSRLALSVDGDEVGTHLKWQGWGAPTATAKGMFLIRMAPDRRISEPGTLTLFGRLDNCPLAPAVYYYARARVAIRGRAATGGPSERLLPPDYALCPNTGG